MCVVSHNWPAGQQFFLLASHTATATHMTYCDNVAYFTAAISLPCSLRSVRTFELIIRIIKALRVTPSPPPHRDSEAAGIHIGFQSAKTCVSAPRPKWHTHASLSLEMSRLIQHICTFTCLSAVRHNTAFKFASEPVASTTGCKSQHLRIQ